MRESPGHDAQILPVVRCWSAACNNDGQARSSHSYVQLVDVTHGGIGTGMRIGGKGTPAVGSMGSMGSMSRGA